MRLNLTLFILLLLGFNANAQKLTGIWRGYFSSSANGLYKGMKEETYKYEIQIDQQSNDGVKGVTYSYKSTVFYGKAELQGIFTGSDKSVVFKETRLVDIKIGDKSEPCLMTCYLDYSKIGKLEILEGTFISINTKDKSDCGSGKVYLERVATSDFKLEDFLVKKKSDTDKTSGRITVAPGTNTTPQKTQPPAGRSRSTVTTPPPPAKNGKDNLALKTPPLKSPAKVPVQKSPPVLKDRDKQATAKAKPPIKKDNPILPGARIPEETREEKTADNKRVEQVVTIPQQDNQQKLNIPKVLIERENKLEKVFNTSEEEVEISLFDNGSIDNDTISIYHNNKLVVSRGKLTYAPITVKIKCSKANNRHELVVVAENLGDIPPNTALMVINPNKKDRTEIFLTSTEQRNAKVIINYTPANR